MFPSHDHFGITSNANDFNITVDDADFILRDSTDATTNILWRDHSASALFIGVNGSADAVFRSDIFLNGNAIKTTQANDESVLEYTVNAETSLYYNGTEVVRTLPAASGGFEVNNTSTGAGFERVLTTSDLSGAGDFDFHGVLEVADETFTSTTTLGYPTEFTYALPASDGNRTYYYEAKLFVYAVSATPDLRIRIDHTGTAAAIISGSDRGQVKVTPANSGATVNVWSGRGDIDVTETAIPISASVAGVCDVVEIHGCFRTTNNNPQGDLRLGFAQSTSSADTLTIMAGSYFRVKTLA